MIATTTWVLLSKYITCLKMKCHLLSHLIRLCHIILKEYIYGKWYTSFFKWYNLIGWDRKWHIYISLPCSYTAAAYLNINNKSIELRSVFSEKPNKVYILIHRCFCTKECKNWCIWFSSTPVLEIYHIPLLESGVAIWPVVEVIKSLGVIKCLELFRKLRGRHGLGLVFHGSLQSS